MSEGGGGAMSVRSRKLSDAEQDPLDRSIREFEAGWASGPRPTIEGALEGSGTVRQRLLVELAHAEVEFRLKAGEAARVEEYLSRFPELGGDREVILDLIRTERAFRSRTEPGQGPTPAEYSARFPELAADLGPPSPDPSSGADAIGSGRGTPSRSDGPDADLPRFFGRYELREEVGRGGFGTVYRGWDGVLKREVAVKVSQGDVASSPSEIDAILREGRYAGDLRHGNIVAIMDGGVIDGSTYLVRSFVKGRTLAAILAEGPIPLARSVRLMGVVARALAYAHGRGLIHRDLKPSNILIDGDDQPYVTDFGLAKRVAGDGTLSLRGAEMGFVGTPAYMSPEQVRGEADRVDGRSDVFNAGVVLYQMLTGRLPFPGQGRVLEHQIEHEAPIKAREIDRRIPRHLEKVCERAMAKRPEDRYRSAAAMADALDRSLKRMPGRRRAKARPGPKLLGRLAIGGLAVALGVVTALWRAAEVRRAGDAEAVRLALRDLGELIGPELDRGLDSASAHRRIRDRIGREGPAMARAIEADPGLARDRADFLIRLSELATARGSDRDALEGWGLALGAVEALAPDLSGPSDRRVDLARCLSRLAASRRPVLGVRAALPPAERAEHLWAAIADAEAAGAGVADDPERDCRRGEAIVEAAEAARIAGKVPDLALARPIAARVGEHGRLSPDQKLRHARSLLALASWELDAGEVARSIALLEAVRALAGECPGRPGHPPLVARAELLLASAYALRGDRRSALECCRSARRRFASELEARPGATGIRRDLAAAEAREARLLAQSGDPAAAVPAYRRALALIGELREAEPDRHRDLADRGLIRADLAQIDRDRGGPVEAAGALVLAITDLTRARILAPGEPRYATERAERVRALGQIARDPFGRAGRR